VGVPEPQRITVDGGGAGPRGAARLAIGEVIDRYRVDEILGIGGMGMVVRARDLDLDRDVALKVAVAAHEPGRDRRRAELLLREARAMAQLRVRNVRAVHDVGSVNGLDYIAMEYIAGVDLSRWLEVPRPVADIVGVFVAAGRGLAAAHAAGVLHRDFKPSNVLVGDDGEVVVTDFGLSRWVHESRPADPGGTPRYMAPAADPSDPRTDQYSFCVALGDAFAHAIRDGLAPRAQRWLDRVVRRGSAAAAAERYPSMTAVVAELEAWLRRPRAGEREPTSADRPSAGRRRWPAVLAAAAAVVAGIAAVAWVDRGRGRDRPLVGSPGLPPADQAASIANRPVDLELAQARVAANLGYVRSAIRHAEAAAAIARTPERRAAAQYELGFAALLQDRTSAARAALESAVQLADEGHDDPLRTRALLSLFQLASTRGSDLAAADRAERAVVAAFARVEPDRAQRVWLRLLQGILALKHGNDAEFGRAIEQARRLGSPPAIDDVVWWGESLRAQASRAAIAGDHETAIAVLRELVATVDQLGGRGHMTAISARGQLARVLEDAGRDADAEVVMTELRAAAQTAEGARFLAEIMPSTEQATRVVQVAVHDRGGAPVTGATIVAATQFHSNAVHLLGAQSAYAERERATAIAVSDARGIAAIAVADHVHVWFAAEHPALGRSPGVVRTSGDSVELVLSPWGALSGSAPPRATISLVAEGSPGSPPIVLRSTAQGRFASERIPHGRYIAAFCVNRGDVERCGARAVAVSSQPAAVALELPPGAAQLTVRPSDELARPIESSYVMLAPGDYAPSDFRAFEIGWPGEVARRPGAFVEWTSVHDASAAHLMGVPPGRYSLCAAAIHGDTEDPSFLSRLAARGAPVPLFCTPIAVGVTAIDRALVIPASHRLWIGNEPRGDGFPQRADPLHW